ncbi:MAG: hypothetical protein ACKVH8_23340 [Pirellulales bacterium]
MKRISLCALIVTINLMAVSVSHAQLDTQLPGFYQPFTDIPFEDYDYQWFAPPITEQYGSDTIDANTGIFFEYHRLSMNVGRGETAEGSFQGDSTHGTRIDAGWMSEEDHGWLFSAWNLDGPANEGINSGDFNSVELNKTWRLDQFHKGSYFEPMIGLRYAQFNDKTFAIFMENNMLLGQLGGRLFQRRGHWMLYSDVRAFAGNNWIGRGDIEDFKRSVVGGEFSVGAAYYFTRELSLDVSWDTTYFGNGIGRNTIANKSEGMTFTGLAVGFTLHR